MSKRAYNPFDHTNRKGLVSDAAHTMNTDPRVMQSLALIALTIPERLTAVLEPVYPVIAHLSMSSPGSGLPSPANLLLACRRLAFAQHVADLFVLADKNGNADQFQADQHFAMGVLSITGAVDNCARFLNDLMSLGAARLGLDLFKAGFQKKVFTALPALEDPVSQHTAGLQTIRRYRHAIAHNAIPLVVTHSETGRMVVTSHPDIPDTVEQFLDPATGAMRDVAPVSDLLIEALSHARSLVAAVCREAARELSRRGLEIPRQPSPNEYGRALLTLLRTGDYNRPDTGPVISEWCRNAELIQKRALEDVSSHEGS